MKESNGVTEDKEGEAMAGSFTAANSDLDAPAAIMQVDVKQ